jgi:NAD+ kinase
MQASNRGVCFSMGQSRMKRIHIVCKRKKGQALTAARRIIEQYGRQAKILLDEVSARELGRKDAIEIEHVGEEADLIIVFGGDGTLLSVARHLKGRNVPILAVNLGGLGFLTEVSLEEVGEMMARVMKGDYHTSTRTMLDVTVKRRDESVFSLSLLNDAVITKDALARIIDIETLVDDAYLTTYRGDGLILSSPTGSTGYSLAAGGPILHPSLEHMVLTPICPHMLTNRPLILPGEVTVTARLSSTDEKVLLTLDGQVGFPLECLDEVVVRKSPKAVKLIMSASKGYFEVLRTKLKWGER